MTEILCKDFFSANVFWILLVQWLFNIIKIFYVITTLIDKTKQEKQKKDFFLFAHVAFAWKKMQMFQNKKAAKWYIKVKLKKKTKFQRNLSECQRQLFAISFSSDILCGDNRPIKCVKKILTHFFALNISVVFLYIIKLKMAKKLN